MPPLAFALPSLVAVLAAGSEAELLQLQEKNLRLKAELEQATGTLQVILDKVEAFDRRSCSGGTCSEPRKSPPKHVSPRSPRRRLTHTAGQPNCLPAATPSFGAGSGWGNVPGANSFAYIEHNSDPSIGVVGPGPGGSGSYYQTTSDMSRTVNVAPRTRNWLLDRVSWELECGGNPAGNGDGYTTDHVISRSGNCTLTIRDSSGSGWGGVQWSVPGLGVGPFSVLRADYEAQVRFEVTPGFALGFDGAPCSGSNGEGVATVAFQYHMINGGTLSLESAEGATLWNKTGYQSSSVNRTGWIQSEAVPVNSASFRFFYVPPESSPPLSTAPLSTAAIAQMAVCCSPPAASSRTYVHHSVPHSFVDAAACLHREGPPLTIRENATSTLSATRTPPRDSNHRACCLTRLRVRCGSRGCHLWPGQPGPGHGASAAARASPQLRKRQCRLDHGRPGCHLQERLRPAGPADH